MPATTKLITYEDSLTMPENRLEEIVNGESRIMPQPTPGHWNLLKRLRRILEMSLPPEEYEMSYGEVGLGIERSSVLTYRIPDIAVFSVAALDKDRREHGKEDIYIWTPPELVIECLSPSNRKGRVEELIQNYQSICVPELWLIDPRRQELTTYVPENGSLIQQQILPEGRIVPLRLPQVSVNINELWKAFDF